jgi:hypothetical protein
VPPVDAIQQVVLALYQGAASNIENPREIGVSSAAEALRDIARARSCRVADLITKLEVRFTVGRSVSL